MRHLLFATTMLLFSNVLYASSSDFDIRLGRGSEREQLAASQLRRLLDTHDVSRYIFTYSVTVREGDVPHSHPRLTINALHLKDDASALSVFLHEQFHWQGIAYTAEVTAAVEDLKTLYPSVPGSHSGGAGDAHSTYVHLLVGLQEYHATASLFGRAEAIRVIARKPHYRWIYQQVLENEAAITAIVAKHSLDR
jgi:hypothetical protein